MPSAHPTRRPAPSRGFTIIELLTVVAIIGILAAILIPTVAGSQTSAKRTKTKVQFSQWAVAIEGFRSEYGYYPDFSTVSAGTEFPTGLMNSAGHTRRLVETLTGRQLDGDSLVAGDPGLVSGNTKRISFCSFSTSDLTAESSPRLQDAFGNTSIVVLFDRDANGLIKIGGSDPKDYTTAPSVGSGSWTPTFPTEGVRAGVIFYSAGTGQSAADIVKSWQ